MSTIITSRWRRVLRWLKSQWSSQAIILHYHRVAELTSDPYGLCVAPQRFAEQLEIVRKHGRPLSLRQLVCALHEGRLPKRAVAITFDDGYADNLYNARPLLEQHDFPATIFVTAGSLGCQREFWWDELEGLLLQPGDLPGKLHVMVNGIAYEWEGVAGARQAVFHDLYELLHPFTEGEQRRVLDALLAWAGRLPHSRPTHRILSADEVAELAAGGLVEIGSHTMSHPVLTALPVMLQKAEIRHSKVCLEQILGSPVMSFAYPHGSHSAETVSAVREAGYACACTSVRDVVWQQTDVFQLPRAGVKDWDGDVFERRLVEWWSAF